MLLAVLLFGVAAIGGVIMALMRVSGREIPPLWLALVHGVIAASGLVSLIISVAVTASHLPALIALSGFIVAALGGFALFSFHLRRKALPLPLVGVHALVAVLSFGILLWGVVSAAA
jgi:hypothetical protein